VTRILLSARGAFGKMDDGLRHFRGVARGPRISLKENDMEAAKHVFVGETDVDEWEIDDETGGLVHILREDAAVAAGLWKPGPMVGKPFDVVLPAHESVIVLTGSGRLEVHAQSTVELKPGVMLSLPKGARTRWIVDEDFSEFWVYSY
jgi:uncharacterized cupin superfamily protein